MAVFTGTRIPVKSLIDHLDRGGSIDEFLQRYRDLPRDTVLAACALGLESLLAGVPVEPTVTQASLLPRTNAQGVVINPEELGARAVVGKRVRCPACRSLVFSSWPLGWDGHAARTCRGLKAREETARKAEFKRRFEHLFR